MMVYFIAGKLFSLKLFYLSCVGGFAKQKARFEGDRNRHDLGSNPTFAVLLCPLKSISRHISEQKFSGAYPKPKFHPYYR